MLNVEPQPSTQHTNILYYSAETNLQCYIISPACVPAILVRINAILLAGR